jgi:hypothetical protein
VNTPALDHARILYAAIREEATAERSTPVPSVANPTIPGMPHPPHAALPRRRVIVRFDLLQGLEMLGGTTAHALAFGERLLADGNLLKCRNHGCWSASGLSGVRKASLEGCPAVDDSASSRIH